MENNVTRYSGSGMAVFNFDALPVRITDRCGNPWFVAKDICKALGIQNSRDAVGKQLEEDEVAKIYLTDSLGRKQQTYIISESGMYALIIRSNKPEAKRFRRWVTGEVLPAIRRQGSYSAAALPAPEISAKTVRDIPWEIRNGYGLWMIYNGVRIIDTMSIAQMLGLTRDKVGCMYINHREQFEDGVDVFQPNSVSFADLTLMDAGSRRRITKSAASRSRWFSMAGLIKLVNIGRKVWNLDDADRVITEPKQLPQSAVSALPSPAPVRVSGADEQLKISFADFLGAVTKKLQTGEHIDPALLNFAGNISQLVIASNR